MITVTLDEYKLFASIQGDKQNNQITELLSYSSTISENYIGYQYESEDHPPIEKILAKRDRYTYFIDGIAVIDTVEYTSRASGETIALEAGVDYVVNDYAITILTVTPTDYDTILITYVDEIVLPPNDVKLAVMLLTQYYMKQEYNKTGMQAGTQQADYAKSTRLPDRVRTILDSYRIL